MSGLWFVLWACQGGDTLVDTSEPTGGLPWAVVDALVWALAESDPFDAERPETVDCPDWGYGEEYGTLEVETDVCTYGSFTQPTLVDLAEGDVLTMDLWYGSLWASEPAQSHIALGVGEEVIWEQILDLPADADAHRLALEVEQAAPAGSAAWLHVHNHGANTYNFAPLVLSGSAVQSR